MKSGCLIVVIAIMIFLTFISVRQGYNTIFHDSWDDEYIQQKAVVTTIYKDSSYLKSANTYSWNYSFEPVVKYTFNKTVKTDTLIWYRSVEESRFYPGDSIAIVISNHDGKLTEAVNQDRVATGIVNLFQGLFFSLIAYIVFRYLKKSQKNMVREL